MTYDFICDKCIDDKEEAYEMMMTFKEFDAFRDAGYICPVCGRPNLRQVLSKTRKHVKIFLKGDGFTRSEA